MTSSNDVVKNIETGLVERTFKAHTGLVRSFVVANDSLITSGYDDMIILWDLFSGSILKRIWLGSTSTLVEHITFKNDQVFTCGLDRKLSHVDFILCSQI
ncbi:hypothetical protein MP638_004275, partial [Amoeboaphelidium occidentale]